MAKQKTKEIDNSRDARLVLCYKTVAGVEFYSCIDPNHVPAARGVAAERAVRFMDMNVTEKTLRELLALQAEAQNKGDYTTAFGITRELQLRLDFLAEEEAMLELACVYCYLRDENPEVPSNAQHKIKLEIMRDDHAARAFFLSIAQTRCKNFSTRPENDLHSYLAQTQGLAERLNRYLSNKQQPPSTSG